MLGPIRAVTVSCPDLDQSVEAYRSYLHYEVVYESTVGIDRCNLWGTPAQADRRMVVLRPAGGDDCYLRLIEGPAVAGYEPIRTTGWNAIELIVEDTDALAHELRESPFKMIGPPEDLSFSDAIRATQVVGPSGEVLYLTMVKRPVEGFDLPVASGPVGRPFIVILGGDLDQLTRYYHRTLGVPEAPVMEAKISVLSNAYGLPETQHHRLCAVAVGGQSYIELDQYPPAATPRPTEAGFLPPGQCMVSFEGQIENQVQAPDDPVYQAGAVAVLTGPAGEMIEVIKANHV